MLRCALVGFNLCVRVRVRASSRTRSAPLRANITMEQADGSKLDENEAQLEASATAQVTGNIIDSLDAKVAARADDQAPTASTSQAATASRLAPNKQQVDEPLSGGQRLRDKFSHRSQSSPSSLTTHKFGLKPTPSPPRLIIDHKTGDIVESYPEQPVYLRTYQPLDNTGSVFGAPLVVGAALPSGASVDDSDADQSSSLGPNLRIDFEPDGRSVAASARPTTMSGSHRRAHRSPSGDEPRPLIPPPHSNKVYFAPPACQPHQLHPNQPLPPPAAAPSGASQGASLFDRQQQLELAAAATDLSVATANNRQNQQHQQGATADQWRQLAGAAMVSAPQQQHFRRTLNRLDENAPTHIAIVTDDDDANLPPKRLPVKHSPGTPPTSSMAKSKPANPQTPLANQPKQLRRQKKQSSGSFSSSNNGSTSLQSIEDFDLYNFCYNFRVLLVCLVSSLIIYLLCFPLNPDCALYRPTQTYISIIVSSVNLICVAIFTLFWYCNGVTRTLYANLSSSAFIITIYSILVGINLAIAILFFFINTCHFQKLINTQLALAPYASALTFTETPDKLMIERAIVRRSIDDDDDATSRAQLPKLAVERSQSIAPANSIEWQHHSSSKRETLLGRAESLVAADDSNDDLDFAGPQTPTPLDTTGNSLNEPPLGDNDGDDDDDSSEPQVENEEYLLQRYTMSPVEAAWHYIEDEFVSLRRKVYRFVYKYDLKFIGALHALCAICFQFLAIKVAVVRSHYCAPIGLAD